jgi:hypothetical protein
MKNWEETAVRIAEEAIKSYENNKQEAERFIFNEACDCNEVKHSTLSCQAILDALFTDHKALEEAKKQMRNVYKASPCLEYIARTLVLTMIYNEAIEYYNKKAKKEEG